MRPCSFICEVLLLNNSRVIFLDPFSGTPYSSQYHVYRTGTLFTFVTVVPECFH